MYPLCLMYIIKNSYLGMVFGVLLFEYLSYIKCLPQLSILDIETLYLKCYIFSNSKYKT